MMNSDDDDVPQLPADTLAALQEFYKEQASLQASTQESEMPEEDWQLSQFWYSEDTALTLAKEAIEAAGPHGRIVCLSCPTLYKKLVEVKPETCHTTLLEYDERFQKFGPDFVFYDYNEPLKLPPELKESFDVVVADPPFLAEECLTKVTQTIRWIGKGKVILCTGAIMEDLAGRLLGLQICPYIPHHTRNLANEFRCFANYSTTYLSKENS